MQRSVEGSTQVQFPLGKSARFPGCSLRAHPMHTVYRGTKCDFSGSDGDEHHSTGYTRPSSTSIAMSTVRARFVESNAVNAPVVAHVKGIKPIDQARAEAILTKFINTTESISTGAIAPTEAAAFANTGMSTSAGKNPVLGQLRRVQRDLRGLPPLLADLEFNSNKRPSETSEPAQNKKIKFDDSDDESALPEKVEVESTNEQESADEAESSQVENSDEDEETEVRVEKEEKKAKKEKKSKKEKKPKKEESDDSE